MKVKHPKKSDKNKPRALKQDESITVKEDTAEITNNERTIFQIPGFKQYNALMKLRIVVSLIFSLCTIAMVILIFVGNWTISAVLLLIGYILVFILMIKLFIVKKL